MSTPLEKAVDLAQASLVGAYEANPQYDYDSWEIFVGNQMQGILDAAVTENAENVRFALRLGATPGEARADALDVEWIDHLPGIARVQGVQFDELMVPVSAIREHFRAILERQP